MKVGGPTDETRGGPAICARRSGRAQLMVDANQVWDVPEAIEWMQRLAGSALLDRGADEPDDVLGHAAIARAIAPVGVATGEHCHNRVMFKQLLQAGAIDYCQIDACRLGGVNEVLAVLLLAAKFGVPVCPHAGGVGLCEYVQHLSMIDYVCVGASLEGRMIEYVDHLHEHFVDPVRMRDGRYIVPERPGYSARCGRSRWPSTPSRKARRGGRDIHEPARARAGAPHRGRGRPARRADLPPRPAAEGALERRRRRRGRRPGTDPRWSDVLEPSRGRVRDPGQDRREPRCRPSSAGHPPHLGAGARRGRRRAARRRAVALAPDDARRVTITTASGVHAGPLAEFALLGLLAFAQASADPARRQGRPPLARRARSRSTSCAAGRS